MRKLELADGTISYRDDATAEDLILLLRISTASPDPKQPYWVLEPGDTDWAVVEGDL